MIRLRKLEIPLMVEVITPRQLAILQLVAKHPGCRRERILEMKDTTEADLAYLEQHDIIREREIGCYRVSHFGEMVLRRGL
jgi:ribosomal protein S13